MLALRSFARRLLVQALVSSTVMAGLQGVVHLAPGLLPFGTEQVRTDPLPTAEERTAAARLNTEPALSLAFTEDRTRADIKAGRFAIWRARETPAAEPLPVRIASKDPVPGLGDVMLFDRCRPGCESQDPLLASHRTRPVAAAVPDSAAEVAEPDEFPTSSTVADVSTPPPENRSTVVAAAMNGVSWARRMAETAGSVVSW